MGSVDESLPDTSPTLFDTAMYERRTVRWPTPKATEWKGASGPGKGGHRGEYLTGAVKRASHPSISSAGGFPVSRFPTLAGDWAPPTNDGSGLSSCVSFARFSPDGLLSRTCQGYSQLTMDGSFEEYSGTFPRAGMMRNGIVYQRQPSAPRTYGTGYSSWPTPLPSDVDGGRTTKGRKRQNEAGLRRWATPRTTDSHGAGEHGSGGPDLRTQIGGQLSATWTELLIGLPAGWTELPAGSAECPEP